MTKRRESLVTHIISLALKNLLINKRVPFGASIARSKANRRSDAAQAAGACGPLLSLVE